MKVGEAGEAFFVVETLNPVSSDYATSPIIFPANTEEVEPLNLAQIPAQKAHHGVSHKRVQSESGYKSTKHDHASNGMCSPNYEHYRTHLLIYRAME